MALEVLCRKRGAGTVLKRSAGWIRGGPKVYAFGTNSHGQLAPYREGAEFSQGFAPMKMEGISVASIGAMQWSSFFITTDGKVFERGYKYDHALEMGEPSSHYNLVERVFPEKIVAMNGSYSSALFLGESGTVYGVGYEKEGQLGLSTEGYNPEGRFFSTPTVVPDLPAISKIFVYPLIFSTTTFSTRFLTADGRVFGCGINSFGTLGLGSGVYTQYTPVPLTPTGVKDLGTCTCGTYFIKGDGIVYVSGANEHYCFGLGNAIRQYDPVEAGLASVAYVTGKDYLSYWVLEDGSLYVSGIYSVGGVTQRRKTPYRLSLEGVRKVYASFDNVYFLMTDGSVFRHGSEGIESFEQVTSLNDVLDMAVGENFVLAITQ